MLKIEPELYFLKVDRFSFGNVNMAMIYEGVLFKNIPQEIRLDWFDGRGQNLSGEDCTCLVDRLEIP